MENMEQYVVYFVDHPSLKSWYGKILGEVDGWYMVESKDRMKSPNVEKIESVLEFDGCGFDVGNVVGLVRGRDIVKVKFGGRDEAERYIGDFEEWKKKREVKRMIEECRREIENADAEIEEEKRSIEECEVSIEYWENKKREMEEKIERLRKGEE